MRCSECYYYECALRSPLGGCPRGEKAEGGATVITTTHAKLRDNHEEEEEEEKVECMKEIRKVKDRYAAFVRKVKALRDAQNLHAKTMGYGYRNLALRLGKEVDEMLDKLQIE